MHPPTTAHKYYSTPTTTEVISNSSLLTKATTTISSQLAIVERLQRYLGLPPTLANGLKLGKTMAQPVSNGSSSPARAKQEHNPQPHSTKISTTAAMPFNYPKAPTLRLSLKLMASGTTTSLLLRYKQDTRLPFMTALPSIMTVSHLPPMSHMSVTTGTTAPALLKSRQTFSM